jgi:AcrR family transcriptional regulator
VLQAGVGYDRVTMDAVAGRAREGKTTICRRWPGKAELVVDALNSLKGVPDIPGTGTAATRPARSGGVHHQRGEPARRPDDNRQASAPAHDGELRRVFREKLRVCPGWE